MAQGGTPGPEGDAALAEGRALLEASLRLRPGHRPAKDTLGHVKAMQQRRAEKKRKAN